MKRKRQLWFLLFCFFNLSLYSAGKYGFVITYADVPSIVDDDERAAAEWFVANYGADGGEIIPTASIKNGAIDLYVYDAIWIHIDRENGTGAIPPGFTDIDVLSDITSYYKNGGNILLSVHATQYIVSMGRIGQNRSPNIIGAGSGNYVNDVWALNPNIGMIYDNSSYPVFKNISTTSEQFGYPVIPLISNGFKEDHNCMWDLNAFGYSGNTVDAFEAENTAKVLATWGHVTDLCCAGIVEFLPTDVYKGKCIAIGPGAYEWNKNDGVNAFIDNIKLLTENSLEYLSLSKYRYGFVTTYENVSSITDDDERAAAEWFIANFGSGGGDLISTSAIKNNTVDLSGYHALWIHVDRENETGALPSELTDNDVLSNITSYYRNGGNILLSTHASRYIVNMERIGINRSPNIVAAGSGNYVNDVWALNPNIGMVYDNLSYPVYRGLSTSTLQFTYPVIPLMGEGFKEDHNCMWDLNAFGYSGNTVDAFESENTAKVLATWGHVTDFCCAGIVEFLPTSDYKGKCMAIGLGAYEWNRNDGINTFSDNIKLLTKNTLQYLAGNQKAEDDLQNPVLVAHFPMELDQHGTSITELLSQRSFWVENSKPLRESIPGAEGNALRFDGFATHVGTVFNSSALNTKAISSTIWCAMESYPMMNTDGVNEASCYIAGNMVDHLQSGFAFTLNSNGRYGFEVYIDGIKRTCYANERFPKYEWVHLSAVASIPNKEIRLYKNNRLIASSRFSGNEINYGVENMLIGKSYEDLWLGPCRINTINGIIDDFRIYAGEINVPQNPYNPQNIADLSIPASRFDNEFHRPLFHAMPAANWANETHGLIYYNNKYHVFFQKNGNGPYWGRIHWGHIVSDDLIHWNEEKTAVDPTDWYDIKGAWSGCVFIDEELTNGIPNIFYTGVDLSRASIGQVVPLDENLISWAKPVHNPVIPNRPPGLSDDFRDPFVFKVNGEFYMTVGTSKDGRGAATLHRYNKLTKEWSNDGSIFYQAASADYGVFWEMPVVLPMSQDKWLFVATPLGGQDGVQALYWVGSINPDGTFHSFEASPKEIELSNMSKHGYGLLSPSVMQKDGKTIAVGVVPDKISTEDNKNLGWAHTFSLPREWSLDTDNNLVQKPYDGLKIMRENAVSMKRSNFNLNGSLSLDPVSGKNVEIEGSFTIPSQSQRFGFKVRKSGNNAIEIYYTPQRNTLTVDARQINRIVNDGGVFDGFYESILPQNLEVGELLKLHVFIDGSILDIFVNDKWAFSVRIFATDADANDIEAFSEGGTTEVKMLSAWNLTERENSPIRAINLFNGKTNFSLSDNVNVGFIGDNLFISGVTVDSKIYVYNQLGMLIKESKIEKYEQKNIILPANQLYIVNVVNDNYKLSKKVIKR